MEDSASLFSAAASPDQTLQVGPNPFVTVRTNIDQPSFLGSPGNPFRPTPVINTPGNPFSVTYPPNVSSTPVRLPARTLQFPTVAESHNIAPLPNNGQQPAAESTVRLSFLPRERRLPRFSGGNNDVLSTDEFCAELHRIIRRMELSPADAAEVVIGQLEGHARREVLSRGEEEIDSSEKILRVLQEIFGDKRSGTMLRAAFHGRRQGANETILDYSYELQSLWEGIQDREGAGPDNTLRDVFVEGLHDTALRRELQRKLRDLPATTYLHAREDARRWEREDFTHKSAAVEESMAIKHGGVSVSADMKEMSNRLDKIEACLNQLVATQATITPAGSTSPARPQHSRRPGTRREPIQCWACGQLGHVRAHCRANPSDQPEARAFRPTGMQVRQPQHQTARPQTQPSAFNQQGN